MRAQETSGTQQGRGDATDPAVEPEKRYTLKGYVDVGQNRLCRGSLTTLQPLSEVQ